MSFPVPLSPCSSTGMFAPTSRSSLRRTSRIASVRPNTTRSGGKSPRYWCESGGRLIGPTAIVVSRSSSRCVAVCTFFAKSLRLFYLRFGPITTATSFPFKGLRRLSRLAAQRGSAIYSVCTWENTFTRGTIVTTVSMRSYLRAALGTKRECLQESEQLVQTVP